MGSQVKAICKCGINTDILIGGGKMNYVFINYFPCLCEDCEDVVQVNLKNILSCPNCFGRKITPYNNDLLVGLKGDKQIIEWGKNILTDGTYWCPKCKKMTLEFSTSLFMWD